MGMARHRRRYGETYDLVVVGGGISGLAAAFFFRAATSAGAKVLVLDNHDDFGGHAKRNEFNHGGRMLMLNGGTLNIEGPGQYSAVSMGLLQAIGSTWMIRAQDWPDHDVYRKLGLGFGVWFNRERFGVDRLVRRRGSPPAAVRGLGSSSEDSPERAGAPRHRPSPERRPARLPAGLGSDEKKRKLMHMSYRAFLEQVAKVHPDAIWFHQTGERRVVPDAHRRPPRVLRLEHGVPGIPGHEAGADTDRPADRRAWRRSRPREPGARRRRQAAPSTSPTETPPSHGCWCARSIPDAVAGRSQEDVVTARVDYSRLDRPGSMARIRLDSTVVNVAHVGAAGGGPKLST